MDAASAGNQPHPRFRQREDRVLRGDDDVAGQRDLETAAHRNAVDGRNERFVQIEPVRDSRETRADETGPLACRLRLEIVSGGECAVARPGNDREPKIVRRSEFVPDRFEFIVRVAVERVHDVGTVQGDDTDAAFVGDVAVLVIGHLPMPSMLYGNISVSMYPRTPV